MDVVLAGFVVWQYTICDVFKSIKLNVIYVFSFKIIYFYDYYTVNLSLSQKESLSRTQTHSAVRAVAISRINTSG